MPTVGTERQFPLVGGDIETAATRAGTFFWRCTWNTISAMLLHRSQTLLALWQALLRKASGGTTPMRMGAPGALLVYVELEGSAKEPRVNLHRTELLVYSALKLASNEELRGPSAC